MGEGPFLNLERIPVKEKQRKKHIQPASVASGLKKQSLNRRSSPLRWSIDRHQVKRWLATFMLLNRRIALVLALVLWTLPWRSRLPLLAELKSVLGLYRQKVLHFREEFVLLQRGPIFTEFPAAPVGKRRYRSNESGMKLQRTHYADSCHAKHHLKLRRFWRQARSTCKTRSKWCLGRPSALDEAFIYASVLSVNSVTMHFVIRLMVWKQ